MGRRRKIEQLDSAAKNAPKLADQKFSMRRVHLVRLQSDILDQASEALIDRSQAWPEFLRCAEYSTAIEVAEDIKTTPPEDWVVESIQEIAESIENYVQHYLSTLCDPKDDELFRAGVERVQAWAWLIRWNRFDVELSRAIVSKPTDDIRPELIADMKLYINDGHLRRHIVNILRSKYCYVVIRHNGEQAIDRPGEYNHPGEGEGSDFVVTERHLDSVKQILKPFSGLRCGDWVGTKKSKKKEQK